MHPVLGLSVAKGQQQFTVFTSKHSDLGYFGNELPIDLNPCSIRFKGWPPHFQRVFLKKPAIHQNLNVAHQAFNGQNQPPSVALPSLSTEKPDTKTSKPLLRLETQSIASRPTFAEFIPMRNPAAPPIALANKRILLPRAMHAPSPATIAGPYGSPAPRDT